jgi:hypothetical protein
MCLKNTLKGLRNDVIIQPYYSKNKTKRALVRLKHQLSLY